MKRKDQWGPLYYIFEIFEDRMDPEIKEKFTIGWTLIKGLAAKMEIPLYDNSEVIEVLLARSREVLESEEGKRASEKADGTDEIVFVKDIDIKIFDHATGKMHSLAVGIKLGGDKAMKELLGEGH